MRGQDSDPTPGTWEKFVFNFGYHPWLWLRGNYGGRWQLRKPIFMIGCPRSGTGAAVDVFALHPDVANLSEAGRLWDPHHYHDPAADHHWTEKDVTAADTKRMHSRFEFWRWFHRRERFINKHPRNSVRIDYLRAMFPDAVFLHVLRDGRAVVNSNLVRLQRQPHRRQVPFFDFCKPPNWRECLRDDPTEQVALMWREIVQHVLGKRNELGACYHQFRYEDLCDDPRKTLAAAWRFAGLRVDDEILDRIPARMESRNDAWKKKLSPEQIDAIHRIQGPLLEQLGYKI